MRTCLRERVLRMQQRLAQSVAEQIRSRIISTRLPAGSRLPTEAELMAAYDVSRSTIREAMKILQAENVVEIRRGLGSFVAENTGIARDPLGLNFTGQEELLSEMMEVRLLTEPQIAALAAERRRPEEIARMEEANSGMIRASAAGEDYDHYDYQFHIAVAECTHNSVLPRLFPVIYRAIEEGYRRTMHLHGSVDNAIAYHGRILEAIRKQDAAAAREAAYEHILQTLREIRQK